MNLKTYFPILDWLPKYKTQNLKGDLSAGVTVGVLLIPQGIAYAMIAGLPPVYGLYAALIPQVIYAIFGTSRQLSVGPSAMDSLLVAAGVSSLAAFETEHYIALTIMLAFLVGVIQISFGLLRLGFLVNFLSKPVISGFTSASALIIGFNQFKHILDIEIERNNSIFRISETIFENFTQINWVTLAIALGSVFIIKNIKKIHQAIPGALAAVILGTLLVQFTNLTSFDVKIIGSIPQGLPSFDLPRSTQSSIIELLPIAFTLALIAFMESISIAKVIQSNHKEEYELNNNQEMLALGMSNLVGSLFGAYPTTGGFSRSAVNDQSGAKTNLASIISAGLILLTLLYLTPLFYYLPKAVLGAIILVAVFGLIDWRYPTFLWKSKKEDFFMLLVAFIFTLSFGIKEGITAGVIVSLLMLIYRTTKPHIAILGKLPDTSDYRNINRFEDIETRPDVLILRHDAQLYFANTANFIDTVKKEVEKKGNNLRLVIFHCGSISNVDSTALQALTELIQSLNKQNISVYFSGVIGPVRDFFHKTAFISEVGNDHFFVDVGSAINYLDHHSKSKNKQKLNIALQTNIFKERDL